MIKKYGGSLTAVVIAIGGIGFSAFTKAEPNPASPQTPHYFRLVNAAQPLQGASYAEITADAYNAIGCSGTTKTCKLKASSATLPASLTDANSNNIPDVTGVVTQVPTRN